MTLSTVRALGDPLDLGLDRRLGDRLFRFQVIVAVPVDAEDLIVLLVFRVVLEVLPLGRNRVEPGEKGWRHENVDSSWHSDGRLGDGDSKWILKIKPRSGCYGGWVKPSPTLG